MERWATFDCYGTLVDWRGGIRRELTRLFPESDADALLDRYYELEAAAQEDGARSYRDVLAAGLVGVARDLGRAVPVGEEDALAGSLPGWPVFADVPAGLWEAHDRGWRLAILSNTDRDLLDASLAAIGIPFELTVVASEIGSYKPAYPHWEVFRARSGATADRHVHVAQSLYHDIIPTCRLGIPSIWINRLGETASVRPTLELPSLTGLADALDSLVAP